MANFIKEFDAVCTAVSFVEDRRVRAEKNNNVGEGILGTAFLVATNSDGTALFATAKHVVQDHTTPDLLSELQLSFSYVLRGGAPTYSHGVMEIERLFHHPTHDVSLIHARPAAPRLVSYTKEGKRISEVRDISPNLKDHMVLRLGTDADVKCGASVLIMGYPRGTKFVYLDAILGPRSARSLVPVAKHGMVCQVVPADSRPKEVFLYDIQTATGFSGSPIVLCGEDAPKVIGVHTNGTGGSDDVGYAHVIRFVNDLVADFTAGGA